MLGNAEIRWGFGTPNIPGAYNHIYFASFGSKDASIFMIAWYDTLRFLMASTFPMMISTCYSLSIGQACATAISSSVRWIPKAWLAAIVY